MTNAGIITSKNDLIDDLTKACKPASQFKIGVEYEKFIYDRQTFKRVPYEGGIERILKGLQRFNWQPVVEQNYLIALERDQASISLEPAGQLELSGAPLSSLHETTAELHQHREEVNQVLTELGYMAVSLGYDPVSTFSDLSWMPKQRYQIMRNYMLKKGKLGLEMMANTCTVQVNLDFSSEQDMIQKFRLSLALQPLATALFASSSLNQGQPNGFQSFRHKIWQDTDPDRCGLLKFVFDQNMSFERYVDYMLDVPMYFVKREGQYLDVAGQSFRDFMTGSLKLREDFSNPCHPTIKDWYNHLTVAFPEVRLKHYLEMRGADGGPEAHAQALPAFWTGLLYDNKVLDAAYALIQDWSFEEIEELYEKVGKQGLDASFKNISLKKWAEHFLDLSQQGLQRRNILNAAAKDESIYLKYLQKILINDLTYAQKLLQDSEHYQGSKSQILKRNVF